MPGMLTRSKSLRFLRNTRKDAFDQNNGQSMPPPTGQTGLDKYQSNILITKAEGRLEPPETVKRPSTSGGPGERKMLFHQKTNLAPSVYSQDQVFSFASPTTSTTVLHTADITREQGVIGIALGSPTTGSHWNSTPQATSFRSNSRLADSSMASFRHFNDSSPSLVSHQQAPKSKLSRWKSMFRKAAPPPSEKPSFYQLAQTTTTITATFRADSPQDEKLRESQVPLKQLESDRLHTVSPPTFKSDIRASRKWSPGEFVAPQSPPSPPSTRERALTLGNPASNPRATRSIQRAFTTPGPPPRSTLDGSSTMPQLTTSKSSGNISAAASNGGPLLDISLPDITMERYSVMFGNLLQPTTNRSSLLERRQGNAEKVKLLNDLSAKGNKQDESPSDFQLQRRATSPTGASPSPRLSLFPSSNLSRAPSPLPGSANRGKPLKRTNTAPAKSPLEQTFSRSSNERMKISESARLKPTASPYLEPALTPTSFHSLESDATSFTIVAGQIGPGFRLHLDEREPEWEICSKPAAVAPAPTPFRSLSQKQPKVTKLTALSSHPSASPLDAPSPLQRLQSLSTPPLSATAKRAAIAARREEDATAKAIVGVARSVSVNRANSPRTLTRSNTDIKTTNEERLVERLVLMPTMVQVRNRRSHMVQLVDA
ncbi:hypothetical protein EJ02DRAFT_364666 [Clathrospora elynae]|uniref:Uncharacterized protein n=1 Tax=Clathrospora elynae TaxID=706981 RepID=A0A6A5TB97_9PLEO|nr:hypothetical protein EJ02DRAFT_364666 [Clathrospora elynae]